MHDPIGRGGMGVVWSAAHRSSGSRVAVKILHRRPEPWFLAQFREEVRSVASLDHPNVVEVYDYGEIDIPLPGIAPGSPYLVMSYAPGGTLARRRGKLPWSEAASLLEQILEALAHAHARGIVHRDLKAGNILLDHQQRPLLCDFGLALLEHRDRDPTESLAGSGTPRYMAPEQFRMRWHDLGPWTDLYALGVLGWMMVAGKAPFVATAFDTLAAEHLGRPLPPLTPHAPVPDGVGAWLGRLLAKDPAHRFTRAGDALAQLRALGPAVSTRKRTVAMPGGLVAPPTPMAEAAATAAVATPLPLRRARPGRKRWLADAGAGLFGLRRLPLVGRSSEQDQLEATLRATHQDRRPRAVVLRGPSGSGKSALARWLLEGAHETAAGATLFAEHAPQPGLGHGLGPMVQRWLHAEGLEGPALHEHLAGIGERLGADDDEVDAWRALIEPTSSSGLVLTPTERLLAVHALLARGSTSRMLVVHLDDVQWGPEALTLAHRLLDSDLPVVVVLTARDEALAERADEGEQLRVVESHEHCLSVPLGPLTGSDRATLVAALFGLAPSLARRVAARTDGNPLFAVQLVGDWVQRGLLRPTDLGFELKDRGRTAVPRALVDVWTGPLDRALHGAEHLYLALLAAASLGPRVDRREWPAICRVLGVESPDELVERLMRRRLATPEGEGWRFVHGMLRETVLDRAHPDDLRRVHDACAVTLGPLGAPVDRVGRHALAAGRTGSAFVLLYEAAERAMQAADPQHAMGLLEDCERAASALTDGFDEQMATLALRARVLTSQGRGDEVVAVATELATRGDGTRWAYVAELTRGRARLVERRHHDAERHLLAGLAACPDDEHKVRARAHVALAMTQMNTGRFAEAEEHAARGLEQYRCCDDEEGIATVSSVLGHLAEERGDWVEAQRRYQEAHDRYVQTGSRFGRAVALDGIASALMFQGAADQALDVIERSLDLVQRIGSRAEASVRQDLGVIQLALGRAQDGVDTLTQARKQLLDGGMEVRAIEVLLPLCWGWALLDDQRAFDRGWRSLAPHLRATPMTASRRWVVERTAEAVATRSWATAHRGLLELLGVDQGA